MTKTFTKLALGDCLEKMKLIPDGSVDMILCDLPYGTTKCSWDTIIPLDKLWIHYKRIAKPNAAIVLTASQPFTTTLISSNMAWFKYCWVWEKSKATGHVHAKNKPMKKHEDVCVFSSGNTGHKTKTTTTRMIYNPIGVIKKLVPTVRKAGGFSDGVMKACKSQHDVLQLFYNYPNTIIYVKSSSFNKHPTQKPVKLMEYLIKTYTNEGDIVLDNCMGSGTTGVACVNTNRNFIGIEKDEKYFKISQERIAAAKLQPKTKKLF